MWDFNDIFAMGELRVFTEGRKNAIRINLIPGKQYISYNVGFQGPVDFDASERRRGGREFGIYSEVEAV